MNTHLEPTRHRFARDQFERMIETGIFEPDDRLELLEGEIIAMSPQKSLHATAVTLLGDALRSVFGGEATVRMQLPFILDDQSEPEPDIAVVPGHPRDYRDVHPSKALLICEVADTSVAYDRGRKQAAYVRAGIPEYWILNLNTNRLEVYRQPRADGYSEQFQLGADSHIAPLAAPKQTLAIGECLP